MGDSPLRVLRYNRVVSISLKIADGERLDRLAREKGYGGSDTDAMGKKLKQPKSGASRLAREIIEDWLTKDLPKTKT